MPQSILIRSWAIRTLATSTALVVCGLLYFGIDRFLINPDVHVDVLDVATKQITFTSAPLFNLVDLDLNSVALEQFKDKVVVVNFWATWCTPCIEEFPSLLRFAQHFNGQIVIVAVAQDKDPEMVTQFLKKINFKPQFPFLVLIDRLGQTANAYGTSALPESYIFQKNLLFKRKIAGFRDWMSSTSLEEAKELVSAKL